MHVQSATPVVPRAGADASSPGASASAGTGAKFAGISNLPHVVFAGIASALRTIGTGLHHVFDSLRNLLPAAVAREAAPAPSVQPTADMLLEAQAAGLPESAESAFTREFPKLTAMLYDPTSRCDDFNAAYRAFDAGILSFAKLLKLRPDHFPEDIARQVASLTNPRAVVAGGETNTQVWNRLARASAEDECFLAEPNVRLELLERLHAARHMAVAFMESAGEPERARRLAALGQYEGTRL